MLGRHIQVKNLCLRIWVFSPARLQPMQIWDVAERVMKYSRRSVPSALFVRWIALWPDKMRKSCALSGRQGFQRTNYWINSANNPEVPDPRYETGGKPLTNNVIGRRRLIDVGAKQQNSIGKIVPFLLHRFLDWILLLLLRQSPPYRSICVAHVFSKTTFSSGLMITKLKSNTKTTGWNKRPGASPTLTTRRNSPGTSRESIANQKDF